MAAASLTVRAYAKVNLDLRIVGLLPDGYHDVRTVLQALRLHDTLTFTPARGRFVIECADPAIPTGDGNLIWRAADLLGHVAVPRRKVPAGMRVRLVKRIPSQAGLGGGSADAAATLVALTRLWGLKLDLVDLACLAARLGADVPFFLAGGTALGVGRGDDISPLAEPPTTAVVVAQPPFGVSTPDAYRGARCFTDADCTRAVRNGFEDVGAAPHSAIHEHRDSAAHRIDDFRKNLDRGAEGYRRAPTVIGYQDTVGPVFAGQPGVFRRLDTLDDELHRRHFLQTVYPLPGGVGRVDGSAAERVIHGAVAAATGRLLMA